MKTPCSIINEIDDDAEYPVFELLNKLTAQLRLAPPSEAPALLEAIIECFESDQAHAIKFGALFHEWLACIHLYPALVGLGLFSRHGLMREIASRTYDRLIPPPMDSDSSEDTLSRLFNKKTDKDWFVNIPAELWLKLYDTLTRHAPQQKLDNSAYHFKQECLYALEMLGIWVAAEELEPELMRIDKRLVDIDSAFIGLQRELHAFVNIENQRLEDPLISPYDNQHIWVMLEQCQEQVDNLRRRAAGCAGSSMGVSNLLERLEQTLQRIELLLVILINENTDKQRTKILELWRILVIAAAEKNSLAIVFRKGIHTLSLSITENKSDHGEHYIAKDAPAFFSLIGSAMGAGVVIAIMAWIKIQIEAMGLSPLKETVWISLNYGLGFVLVHFLSFTIATKQPAMTAASMAAEVEHSKAGRAAHPKLARLLIDVNRSQWAAVWGNVSTAILTALAISFIVVWQMNEPVLTPDFVTYHWQALAPFSSLALLYAAIAGVWLFCSGIIAGYFDNRADYLELRLRLRQLRLFNIFGSNIANKLANYLHENYGAIMGNFFFGVMLGTTGYIGYLIGLPLDIRHVAFSSANLGFITLSSPLDIGTFLLGLVFVLMIGFVNLWVSFSLALWVALKSRGARIGSFSGLLLNVLLEIKHNPLRFFFPVVIMQKSLDNGDNQNKHIKKYHSKPNEK
ncbi:site-specific recombinase [Thiomicrospira pelophila]|uniref:site-specific recombinase n=1 Tax=Thiomicrospira pelophila TaxID=934 RepID=UPI00068EC5F5|nr:site-specific recombinase [Thiomicrospira pelophila]